MINYLRYSIPNMAETIAPLQEQLKTSVPFDWLAIHIQVLNKLKNKVRKSPFFGKFSF